MKAKKGRESVNGRRCSGWQALVLMAGHNKAFDERV